MPAVRSSQRRRVSRNSKRISPKRPVSPRKLDANRRNASKSTGPRTPEGKARSAQNALRHGMFCNAILLPGEDASAFHAMRVSMVHDLRPSDAFQLILVERIVADTWRLQRLAAAEHALYEAHESSILLAMHRRAAQDREEDFAPYDESKGDDPAEMLRCLDTAAADAGSPCLRGMATPKSLAADQVLLALLINPDAELDRFQRYETRLSLSLARNERMLRARQKVSKSESEADRAAREREIAATVADEDANHRNEPTVGAGTSNAVDPSSAHGTGRMPVIRGAQSQNERNEPTAINDAHDTGDIKGWPERPCHEAACSADHGRPDADRAAATPPRDTDF